MAEVNQIAKGMLLCYALELMSKDKITGQTKLAELLEQPELVAILAGYRLPCLGCPMIEAEMDQLSLAEVARRYGLPLEEMIRDLNRGL